MTPSWFQTSVPTHAQLDAWAADDRAIFAATQAEADERDRGLDIAMRGRRMRRPEPLVGDDA